MIGDGPCVVKTLTRHHLYCEPPMEQPLPRHHALRETPDALPEFTVSRWAWAGPGPEHVLKPCSLGASHVGADGEPALLPGPRAIRWREPRGFSHGGPGGLGGGHLSSGSGRHHHCLHIQVGAAGWGWAGAARGVWL